MALEFYRSLPGVAASNHALVQRGRELIADALGTRAQKADSSACKAELFLEQADLLESRLGEGTHFEISLQRADKQLPA